MRRHATGVIALVLLGLAGWFFVSPPTGPVGQELQAAFARIGVVMAVIWLAYDQVKRVPPWILWTLPVFVIVLAFRPRYLLILVPLVIAMAILRPRSGRRRS